MKWCEHCKVHVDTDRKICPLCFNSLVEESKEEKTFDNYPKRIAVKKKYNIFYRILIFIFLLAISISLLVNFLTYKEGGKWWSLYVVIGVVYVFILIRNTLYARINMTKKLVIQELFISLLVLGVDALSGNKGWALSIVIPSVCMATNITGIIVIICNRKNFGESLMPTFLIMLLGIVPFILQLFNLIKGDHLWAPLSSCALSVAILMGFIIFGGKEIIEELRKRLHI